MVVYTPHKSSQNACGITLITSFFYVYLGHRLFFMESFIKEAIRSIKTSGTIKPSSKYLIRNCLKDLDFQEAKTIVEFGVGDGCFTKALDLKMQPDTNLYAFEINPTFFAHCHTAFSTQKNIHILNKSALEFDEVLKAHTINKVDYIISSLPLTNIPNEIGERILQNSYRVMQENIIILQCKFIIIMIIFN